MPSPDVGAPADLPLTFATDNRSTEITSGARPTISDFPTAPVPFGAVTAAPAPPPATGPWSDFAGDAAAAEAAAAEAAAAEAARPRPAQWDKVQLGLLLVGIAECVGIGAFGLIQIGLLFSMVDALRLLSPAEGGGIAWNAGSGIAALRCKQIAFVFVFAQAVTVVVGYVFWLFAPQRHGAFGLAVAALCLGGLNVLVAILNGLVPAFRAGAAGQLFLGTFGGAPGGMGVGAQVLQSLATLLFFSELVVAAVFLRSVARCRKDRQLARNFIGLAIVTTCLAAYELLFPWLAQALWSPTLGGFRASWIVFWVLHWIGAVLCAGVFTWYLVGLFRARATLRG
jgi:hypothetical protein